MTVIMTTPDVGVEFERITPDKARGLLELNTKNRNLNKRLVTLFARQMIEGKWRLNGDAIRLDWDGHLLDGQHRLAAVVESGTTQPMLVVNNLDPAAQLTIDTGRRRSAADVLRMEGFGNENVMAAMVKLLVLYYNGTLTGAVRVREVTNEEVLTFATAQKEDIDYSISQWVSVQSKFMWEPSSAAMAHFVFSNVDNEAADDFFHKLSTGEDLSIGNPILAYRHRLETEAMRNRQAYARKWAWRYRNLLTAFRVWNAWRDGKELQRVLTPRTGNASLPNLK